MKRSKYLCFSTNNMTGGGINMVGGDMDHLIVTQHVLYLQYFTFIILYIHELCKNKKMIILDAPNWEIKNIEDEGEQTNFKDTFIKTVETHYSILKGRLKQKDQTQKFYDLQLSKIYSSFINSIFSTSYNIKFEHEPYYHGLSDEPAKESNKHLKLMSNEIINLLALSNLPQYL